MVEKVHDRLDSWKAIAEYLDHDPTTVMRWAKERGLPVYVVPGEGHRHRAVYAHTAEIDAWLRKLANHAAPTGQNDRPSGVAHPEKAHAEQPSERAAPQGAGVSVAAPHALPSSPSSRPGSGHSPRIPDSTFQISDSRTLPSSRLGTGRSLWAVLLGGTILIAVAAASWLRVPAPEPKVLGFEQLTEDGLQKGSGLATDGTRIYFIENGRDGWAVAEVPTSGGGPVAIAKAGRDTVIQDISPDRTELLLIEEGRFRPGSVWILPLLAGSTRRLGAIQAFSAAWSPDGLTLAYTTDDGLYLCEANGSNSRRILAMSGRLPNVRWSPDGRQLCVTRFYSNQTTLWEVGRDGKDFRRPVPNWDMPYGEGPGFWAPDGNYFIFQASHAGHTGLWALRLPAGLLRRNQQATCLGPAGVDLSAATMSLDRSRLYCVGSTRAPYHIERFDARSNQFVPFLPEIPATVMDFTKDGQWVAYVDDNGWLWKSRQDGSEKVQLTLPPLRVELPRWSPDGKWIAFMGEEPGQRWKVRLVSAEGGPYGPVTSTDASEGAPTWSPEGSRLVFGGLVNPGTRTPGPLVIHIFDLKEHRLSVVPGSEGLWAAHWSPDGHYIAALTEDSRSLMLFDSRAGKWTKVPTPGEIWHLHWSRQGRSIYLIATPPGGERTLFRVKVPGQQTERLSGMASKGVSDPLGLAPDDSPLVTRHVSGEEIYALDCQFP